MVVIEGTTLYVKFPIKAGNDLLCCTDYITQIPAVYEAIKNNEISLERIDESLFISYSFYEDWFRTNFN